MQGWDFKINYRILRKSRVPSTENQEKYISLIRSSRNSQLLTLNFYTMDYNKAKEMMRLQQEMSKVKKELANTHIEAEVDGLVITIDGEMKVVSVVFEDKSIIGDEKKLEKAILEATNKGMKKAQEVASTKMQSVAKDMGIDLGGMMGG